MQFKKIGPITTPSSITNNTFLSTLYSFDSNNKYFLIHKKKYKTKNPFVRITSRCVQGHIFGSKRCDCRAQFYETLKYVLKNNGLLIYAFNQDGRGIGLEKQMQSYMLGDRGIDSYDALLQLGNKPEEREYSECAEILKDLGIQKLFLVTNNFHKVDELEKNGLNVQIKKFKTKVKLTKHNKLELIARKKLGHAIGYINK